MFVSRAGAKLDHALTTFNIDVKDFVCADFGCSTGGFTDCMLQRGAQKVYSIDTGYGVLEWKLRQDPRVEVKERQNALHVELPEKMDFISIDVSWTRQKLILPQALKNLKPGGQIVSLLKPHYEAPKSFLEKGKLPDEKQEEVIEMVKEGLADLPIKIKDIIESPIAGGKGKNKEYLMWIMQV